MDDSVDYQNRGINLPPGCKDLIDVLKLDKRAMLAGHTGWPSRAANELPAKVTHGATVSGLLGDVLKYVKMAFDSRAREFLLMISPPGGYFLMDVHRNADGMMASSVMVQADSARERAVHFFFAHRGLEIPKHVKMPQTSSPSSPPQVVYHISPIPNEAWRLADLLMDLLHHAFKLGDGYPLSFRYFEISV
jgi:hypothetical protein